MEPILDAPLSQQRTFAYAGFWIRVGAAIIDGILLAIVNWILSLALLTAGSLELIYVAYLLNLVVNIAYYAGMESSDKQATLGKMAVGIKVGNENGEKLSFANAAGRYLGKILSAFILLIGYIMVAFDEKKQGLHDKLANTYVFYA
jgi:uncharacterized RDD family membrane protein YckC